MSFPRDIHGGKETRLLDLHLVCSILSAGQRSTSF